MHVAGWQSSCLAQQAEPVSAERGQALGSADGCSFVVKRKDACADAKVNKARADRTQAGAWSRSHIRLHRPSGSAKQQHAASSKQLNHAHRFAQTSM